MEQNKWEEKFADFFETVWKDENMGIDIRDEIINFIKSLLLARDNEIKEIIEDLRENYILPVTTERGPIQLMKIGYQTALDDIINNINSNE